MFLAGAGERAAKMEWSNEKALEFLELFQMEPCLWDPRLPTYKNRTAQNDAWRRIKQSLSFDVTQEQLKTKKDSLMGYYRIHLNKYKKSLKSGAGRKDVYTTNWYAFDLMDSFLRPIYGTKSIINTETDAEENNTEESSPMPLTSAEPPSNNSSPRPSTSAETRSNTEGEPTPIYHPSTTFKRSNVQYQKPKTTPGIINAERQMNEAFGCLKALATKKKEEMDEYDHFAHMIASKIRKIQNLDDREMLMNTIQNLTFQYYMNSKQKISNTSPNTIIPETNSDSSMHSCVYIDDTSNERPLSAPLNNSDAGMAYYASSPSTLSAPLIDYQNNSDAGMACASSPTPSTSQVPQYTLSISKNGSIQILSDEIVVPAKKLNK